MSKVINISGDVYPIEDVLIDLAEIKKDIKDLVFVVIQNDGTTHVSHTGLSFQHMALACKLLDKEFDNMIELAEEEQDV